MKRSVFLVIILLFPIIVKSQDIHFSQMAYSPLTLNPALAGANYDLQVNVNYRNQWNSVATPFQTIATSVDTRLNAKKKRSKKAHVAAGINFFNDRAGEMQVMTNNVNLNFATHVMLGDGHTLGAGIYGGWAQRSLNTAGGQWGSQYNGKFYDPLTPHGEQFSSAAFSMFDVGAGLLYTFNSKEVYISANNTKQMNIGFATYHLNRPGFSFIQQDQEKLYMRFSGFINGSFGIKNTHFMVEPGAYFHQQGNAREIFFGLYGRYIIKDESRITSFVTRTTVALGLFCRNQDALVAKAHFEWNGLGIGLAYDFNLFSSLISMSRSRGGIEVALRWVVPNLYVNSSKIK